MARVIESLTGDKVLPPSPAAAPGNSRLYFPELDGVRAIAAFMIIVFHFGQTYPLGFNVMVGQTGVDLFFVLSGFLITSILLQAGTADLHEVRNFYIRRTLRIFPLYYGYLILFAVLFGGVSWHFWVYLQNIFMAFNMPVMGPGHFWSLAVEEQFYLVWPFLVLFLPRRWLATAMWSAIAFSTILRLVLAHTKVELFYLTFTRIDALAAGGLLSFYYLKGSLKHRRILLILLAVLSLGLLGLSGLSHADHTLWSATAKFSAAAGLYSSVIGLLLITADTPIHRALKSSFMRAIGRVSYGLYVYHPLVLATIHNHLHLKSLALLFSILLAIVYIISAVSFYGFEKRFTDLKQRLAPEKRFRVVSA